MLEKIVQRVPVAATDNVSDLICLIDLIEFELGLSTGGKSMRNRLLAAVTEIRRSKGVASEQTVAIFQDVIERLGKIERHLLDNGFETATDTSDG